MGKHLHVELNQDERNELEQLIHSWQRTGPHTNQSAYPASERPQSGPEAHGPGSCRSCSVQRKHRGQHSPPLSRGRPAAALNDKGWPGAKPKLTGEVEAKLTMLACSEPPKGHARWTLRLLANQMVELGYVEDVSHVTVGEWLKKTT